VPLLGLLARVSEHLERLHNRGFIGGYRVDIYPTAHSWSIGAIIGITTQQDENLQALVNHLMTLRDVIMACIVTGRRDVLLSSVRARSNQALRGFVAGLPPAAPGFMRSGAMVRWQAQRTSTGAPLVGHDHRGS
jgi:DNA-binding Lrp family transcriptional regulator